MKRLLFILILAGFLDAPAIAQEKKPKAAASRPAKATKQKPKTANYSKAGKSDPTEKGSGMTMPKQDQPNLDKKPNPAATVPSKELPVDNDGKPQP